MTFQVTTRPGPGPDTQHHGISRSLALGRIMHFEALMRRRLGEVRPQRYVRMHNYYSGQNLPPDNVDQPLMINRFKPIVDKHTSYLWGQWKQNLFDIRVTPINKDDMEPDELEDWTEYGRKIKRFLDRILNQNNRNKTFWQASKNASLFGDGILECRYDERQRRIVLESVLPEYFHAMWEISNMQELTEVVIAYPIDRVAALEQWGTSGNDQFIGYQAINPHYLPGIGILWKRWSTTSFQVWVDDVNVVNSPNPYMPVDQYGNLLPGIIPYIHVVNMQGGAEYWGYSDAEAAIFLIDELNRRLADMGDIVNTHAHPVITLSNFSGTQSDLPVGPDSVWDLGREGKADRLDGKGPAPEVMAYIEEVKKEIYETSSMPETAYGSRGGGGGGGGSSHSSGLALAMAMMPVVERAKEKRIAWAEGIERLCKMIFYMLWVRDPALLEAAGLDYERILMYTIEPVFADILPKEQLQLINENVATNVSGLRSLERALESLGEEDIQTEIRRIKEDMQFKASLGQPVPGVGTTAGKNSEQGMGSSADIPGGIGASASKPGTLIKSPDQDKTDSVALGSEP